MVRDLYTPVIPQVILCSLAGRKIYALFQQEFIKVPEQQCSSRTDSASIHLSWSKCSGSVEGVPFLPHLCTIQTKHRLYFPHSAFKLINLQRNRKYNFFLFVSPPCATGSIHSWLFRQREINQVAPCGPPTNLESLEKIKICATKLKILIWCASESTVNQREEMWSWCKILLGSAVLYQSKLSSLMLMLWPSAHQSFKKKPQSSPLQTSNPLCIYDCII